MSYKKVKLLKKQISTDFGVTWVDVAPKVTKPSDVIVDTYDTYSECMYGISEEDLETPDFVGQFPGYKRIEWSDNLSVLTVDYCAGCNGKCAASKTMGEYQWAGSLNTATDLYVAFSDCVTGITSGYSSSSMNTVEHLHIYLPDSLIEIGNNAFGGYSNIDALSVPQNVERIGNNAIRCNKLIMNSTTPPTLGTSNTFTTIYVPSASVDTYKNAAGWSNYSNRIYGY